MSGTLLLVVIALVAWCAVSLVVALAVGRRLGGAGRYLRAPADHERAAPPARDRRRPAA